MRLHAGLISKFRQKLQSQSGYAIEAVLICVALGSTVVVSSLHFSGTILKDRMIMDQNISRLYAAEAGIEDAISCIKAGVPVRSALPQNINDAQVAIQVEDQGFHVMYSGEWVTTTVHSNWLLINSSVEWDAGANAYAYTITLTRNTSASGNIDIFKGGAHLPDGFTYQSGSAGIFTDNLSELPPADTVDEEGNHLLNWVMGTPRPKLTASEPTRTQKFYITGESTLQDYYSWAVAQSDIGVISELYGDFFVVTATATGLSDGKFTTIVSDVMLSDSDMYVISWRVNP